MWLCTIECKTINLWQRCSLPFVAISVCIPLLLHLLLLLCYSAFSRYDTNVSTLNFPTVNNTSPVFSCNKLTSMWLVLFQSLLIFLDLSNGIFCNKAEKQLWSSISLFHTVLGRKIKEPNVPTCRHLRYIYEIQEKIIQNLKLNYTVFISVNNYVLSHFAFIFMSVFNKCRICDRRMLDKILYINDKCCVPY